MQATDSGYIQRKRPSGITCRMYQSFPGQKRCRYFLKNGACSKPDELMCREWVKANGPFPGRLPSRKFLKSCRKAAESSPVDLFGNYCSGNCDRHRVAAQLESLRMPNLKEALKS